MTDLRRRARAPRTGVVDEVGGCLVADPYRWLEDPADRRTATWIAEQDALFAEHRAGWAPASRWAGLVGGLSAVTVTSAPVVRGDRVFFLRRRPGADHAVLHVHDGRTVRTLVDPGALDPTGATVLEAWHPSIEGGLLAYQLSAGDTEDAALRVLDVRTGEVVEGPIDRVRRASVAWLPGGRAFYLVRRLPPELVPGEERYHRRVYLHTVGTDPETEDVLVFGEGRSKTQFYTAATSADGRRLAVTATEGADPSTDLWLADLREGRAGKPALVPVHPGVRARTRPDLRAGGGPDTAVRMWTNLGAPRGRLVAAAAANPTPDGWRELVAERADAVLEDFVTLDGPRLERPLGLLLWRRHAISELTLHDLAGGELLETVRLPGRGTVTGLAADPAGGHQAWFVYTDYATAPGILRYDALTGRVDPWPEPGADQGRPIAETAQVSFASADGTTVRMFVVSPAGRPDRPRPAILTGYGGFGASNVPSHLPHVLAWVAAGGVFAVANLRGGGEEGEAWHRAGRGENKQNVFDDFAAAADHLVADGWTTHERLGVMGGSNGGLLVAAALVQYPEKFAAAVSMDPLTDMLRYERSGLGPSWRREYGSVEDPAQCAVLLSYSPYHRVAEGATYPPTLFTVSDADTRVDPLHARKMCAALQHASAGPGPILLRIDRGVGHGARAVSKMDALFADALTFLGAHLGLDPPPPATEPDSEAG